MKNILIYTFIGISSLVMSSCSIQDAVENGERLPFQALSMHILAEDPVIAQDTGYFQILASNPDGKIVKFSVNHLSDFKGFIEKTKIQVSDSITVNENGELSRPASTILINYPMVGTSTAGEILTAEFTFTDDKGNTTSIGASKKVVNYRSNAALEFLFVSRPWHNLYNGKSYATALIDDNETFRDSLAVYWSRIDGIQYLASPDADETAADIATRNPTVNYVQSEMQDVKLIKLTVTSLDEVDDDLFADMDFSAGADRMEVEDKAIYGLLLEDGRKAALEIQIYLTQYSRVRSKVQVAPN